jgi:hypothetical protein
MITAHAFTPDAFAGDGGIREELAAGVKRRGQAWLPGSIQDDSGLPQGPAVPSGAC